MTDRNRDHDGKVVVVTGAASGIGECVAHTFAGRGAHVVVADINREGADIVAGAITDAGGTATGFGVDIAEEDQVAALMSFALAHYGRLDIVHNNAADTRLEIIGNDGDVATMTVGIWDRTMAVNLRGTMLGCKYAIPHMLARGSGVIVNMSSDAGLCGDLARPAYGSSKGAIVVLTQYVATQYGRKGIRCNAVAPSLVLTPSADRNLTAEMREIFKNSHLTTRLGVPEDIANLVAFLASDEGSFINGQVICADGGMLAHTPAYAQFIAD